MLNPAPSLHSGRPGVACPAPWVPSCFLRGELEAASAVCLHVPDPADGLDMGVVGSPLVPVLVGAHLKDVLVSTVTWVLVTHPCSTGDLDAGNAILEAVGPEGRDVLVTHLHLTTLKVHALKQADLVVLGVLECNQRINGYGTLRSALYNGPGNSHIQRRRSGKEKRQG